MMAWWPAPSIRVRLTAWYALVLCLMLAVYAAAKFGAQQPLVISPSS